MTPENYAAFAIDHLRAELASPAPSRDTARLGVIVDLLCASEKFLYPLAKDELDRRMTSADGVAHSAVVLNQPVCIEAPWQTRVALTGFSKATQSSRRLVLCWEACRDNSRIDGWEVVFDHYPSGGVFLLPICWLDGLRQWQVLPTGAFLPHSPGEGINVTEEIADDNSPMLPYCDYLCAEHVLHAHPMRWSDASVSQPRKISRAELMNIIEDLRDEILLAVHALPMLPHVHADFVRSDVDSKRGRSGKQAFFHYRELGGANLVNSVTPPPATVVRPVAHHLSHLVGFGMTTLRAINLYEERWAADGSLDKNWLQEMPRYRPSKINLLVGKNGAGKSTVIDMIDCLRDATKLAGMQRENTKSGTVSGFLLQFAARESAAIALFSQANSKRDGTGLNMQTVEISIESHDIDLCSTRAEISKFSTSEADVAGFQQSMDRLDLSVHFFDGRKPPKVDLRSFVSELCKVGEHLPQTAASTVQPPDVIERISPAFHEYRMRRPIEVDDDDRVNLWLGDDTGQTSRVKMNLLPSGWRAYATLTAWLSSRPIGSLCLIEEPETHLHPTLQRLLARRLGEVAEARHLQLFVATHAPTLINAQSWGRTPPKIFQAQGATLVDHPNVSALLRDLGIRQSDILQANGVVWVEGPSDAIYLRYWIEVYCREIGQPAPLEELDFVYMPYGGAVLSHFSAGSGDELFDMLRLNQNLVVVMDRDLDFPLAPDESAANPDAGGTKARIAQAVRQLDFDGCWTWITQAYTVESYLPNTFRASYFTVDANDRLVKTTSLSKVEVARRFVGKGFGFRQCFDRAGDLKDRIANLVATIRKWNTD